MVSFVASEQFAIAMIVVVISLFMNEMDIIVQIMTKMDIIVQWATILSPIIAVLIAWWTVRSSAKDTAKKIATLEKSTREQIAALDENTKKQVDSVKELTKIQIKTAILQANIEMKKLTAQHKQLTRRVYEESQQGVFANQYGEPFNTIRQEKNRQRDMMDEQDLTLNQLKEYQALTAQFNELYKEVGEK